MSLVFAAFTPHPPLLLPSVDEEKQKKIAATKQAYELIEQELYAAKPETILLISSHAEIFPDAFSMNVSPEYTAHFKEFGDLGTKKTFAPDMSLAVSIKESAKKKKMPLVLQSQPELDYGTGIPLIRLTAHLNTIQIIPITHSFLDPKMHFDFGYLIKEEIMKQNKRVAVIASGDLSHRLQSNAPGGFHKDAETFDTTFRTLLSNHNTTGMLQLDQKMVEEVQECGWRPVLILLGILQRVEYTFQILSYEAPLGVGYLTANFALQ